jgi:hypothetical protein
MVFLVLFFFAIFWEGIVKTIRFGSLEKLGLSVFLYLFCFEARLSTARGYQAWALVSPFFSLSGTRPGCTKDKVNYRFHPKLLSSLALL